VSDAESDGAGSAAGAGGVNDAGGAIRWIYAFVDRPFAQFERACEFWLAATGTRLSARRGGRGEFATLLPDGADGASDAFVKIQGVGDGGGAHLDLAVEDVPGYARRAIGLGATAVFEEPGLSVLRSPAGKLFCVCAWEGESRRPAPLDGPGPDGSGGRSRLDQVCIDVAPRYVAAEVEFWGALTGWERHPGRHGLVLVKPRAGLPVRILVQRLDSAGEPTGAHIDIACADIEAVRAWHEESLGATAVRVLPWRTIMRDPVGGTYCLTNRDPDTGEMRGWA
jgi:hypothetical protein